MKNTLIQELKNFEKNNPHKTVYIQRALSLLESYDDNTPFLRSCFDDGHFTGSMLVINKERTRILLMHHVKFGTWQQFGGHADGEMNLRNVAVRELQEESGIDTDKVEIQQDMFYMDIHSVPAYKNEPQHYHYDVGYLTITDEDILFSKRDEEVHEIKWFDISSVRAEADSGKYSSGLIHMLENI